MTVLVAWDAERVGEALAPARGVRVGVLRDAEPVVKVTISVIVWADARRRNEAKRTSSRARDAERKGAPGRGLASGVECMSTKQRCVERDSKQEVEGLHRHVGSQPACAVGGAVVEMMMAVDDDEKAKRDEEKDSLAAAS